MRRRIHWCPDRSRPFSLALRFAFYPEAIFIDFISVIYFWPYIAKYPTYRENRILSLEQVATKATG